MLSELTQEELSLALDTVASEAITTLEGPPVDAVTLAHALQLNVAWDERQSGRGRIVRLSECAGTPSRGSILLRPDPRPERLQWAVAHEIGELFANRVFDQLGIDPREAPDGTRETVANQLAGRLLLPRRWFADAGADRGWDLIELKQRFSTASHELIARRMLDFPPTIGITIFDNGRRTLRRGNMPSRMPPLVPLERAAWQQAHDSSEPAIEADYLCRVQAWPIHAPDWKREILRTEWLMEGDAEFD